jgi:uncharacterized protein (TIRG00374 family)
MTPKQKRFGWPTVIGIAVTIPLLWWSVRDIHFAEVVDYFRDAHKLALLATMAAAALALPARAARWRLLLRHESPDLRFPPLYHATAAGFAVNNILPARAGEIARAFAARRLTGVRFASAITTIVLSRILDGVTLFAILAMASLVGWFSSDFVIGGVAVSRIMTVATIVFGVLIVLGLAAVKLPRLLLSGADKICHRLLPSKLADRVVQGLNGVIDSLAILRNPRRLGIALAWSAVVWGVNGLSFLLAFIAFDLDVPWHAAFVLQSLVNFGLVIPSTPGFVGVFEVLVRGVLVLYGIDATAAVSYAVAYHFCSYLPITVLGLGSLAHAHIRMGEVQEEVHERISGAVQRMTGAFQQIPEGSDGA